MVSVLQAVMGFLLIFFLPGFTLVKALFPKKEDLDPEFGGLYQVVLGMGMSVVITIVVGILLGSLPLQNGKGQFTAPNIILLLSVITITLFAVGTYRNAYPRITKQLKAWRERK